MVAAQAADPVDWGKLEDWMYLQGFERAPVQNAQLLAGGTQNVILRFDMAGRSFVLRRPPLAVRKESNNTMRREARVLRALSTTAVPHPRLIAACEDEEPLGYAFYLMEPVAGFNATSGPLPAFHAGHPDIRHAMGLALVDGAATLAEVDYLDVGLAEFGKPDNYLERQVTRWRSQLEGYAQYDGWPGMAALPGVEAIGQYLEANRPPSFEPGIIHGDYSLGNVMFEHDSPRLAAIIDWELATIGDPLIDLGWLLATWNGVPPVDLSVLVVEPWEGFPSADELIEHYAKRSTRDLSHIGWYAVLACYKLGIILEGTFARACAGLDPMEMGQRLHDTAERLFRRALYRIEH